MSNKNIFIHDSVVSPFGQRGVNRYFLKFIQAVYNTYRDRVLIYSGRKFAVPSAKIILPPSRYVNIDVSYSINKWLTRLDSPIAQIIADSTSEAYYSPYFGHVRTKIPQVYTVPDMIYEKFPEYFPVSDKYVCDFVQEKRECLERAALILPISQSTAKDIIDVYPHIPTEKIKVVYLGVDNLFFQGDIPPSSKKPYFLFVGNRDKYKNFLRFLQAFGKSGLSRDFDLRLILPTQSPFTSDEMETIQKYHLTEHIIVETSITDIVLRDRYRQAYAFVYSTEYEGFGLPVLEAMASGTLVLASQVASIPEIGIDIPLYFNPLSEEAIIITLIEAAQLSSTEREQRIERGKARATQFSWRISQDKFMQEFKTILYS